MSPNSLTPSAEMRLASVHENESALEDALKTVDESGVLEGETIDLSRAKELEASDVREQLLTLLEPYADALDIDDDRTARLAYAHDMIKGYDESVKAYQEVRKAA